MLYICSYICVCENGVFGVRIKTVEPQGISETAKNDTHKKNSS